MGKLRDCLIAAYGQEGGVSKRLTSFLWYFLCICFYLHSLCINSLYIVDKKVYMSILSEIFKKEYIMFKVTELASRKIREFFKDRQEIPPIRIMLSQGG